METRYLSQEDLDFIDAVTLPLDAPHLSLYDLAVEALTAELAEWWPWGNQEQPRGGPSASGPLGEGE